MKIFITKNSPNVFFIYKVLRFLRQHTTEKELRFYFEQICEETKEKY